MQVISGLKKKPFLGIIYGQPGRGKTSLASQFPKPIFIGTENHDAYDFDRLPACESVADTKKQLVWVDENAKNYKTLVIDTMDGLEKFFVNSVCDEDTRDSKKCTIHTVFGGFNAGPKKVERDWIIPYYNDLLDLREKHGLNIVILAHSRVRRVSDPITLTEYDKIIPDMENVSNSFFSNNVPIILYLTDKTVIDEKSKSVKSVGSEIVMLTEGRKSHEAKNRFNLPYEIPFVKGKGFAAIYHYTHPYFDFGVKVQKKKSKGGK